MPLMGYPVLLAPMRHKTNKSGVDPAALQWPQTRNGKQRTSQTVTGGRNGGYVIYLLTFASVEQYTKLIDEVDEENLQPPSHLTNDLSLWSVTAFL